MNRDWERDHVVPGRMQGPRRISAGNSSGKTPSRSREPFTPFSPGQLNSVPNVPSELLMTLEQILDVLFGTNHVDICDLLWAAYVQAPAEPPDSPGFDVAGTSRLSSGCHVDVGVWDREGYDCGAHGCGIPICFDFYGCVPPRTAVRMVAALLGCEWAFVKNKIPNELGGGNSVATPISNVPSLDDFGPTWPETPEGWENVGPGIPGGKCCWWWDSCECPNGIAAKSSGFDSAGRTDYMIIIDGGCENGPE